MTSPRFRARRATPRVSGKLFPVFGALVLAFAARAATPAPGHYLFAWAGDVAMEGDDFLAVIDADPRSTSYGRLVASVATDQKNGQVHHTEYTMPEGGMLFANDHVAGRSFIFDLRDPLHPKVATSFMDMGGFSHPHSFLRLPNGHVIVSFQYVDQHPAGKLEAGAGISGGIEEIDDQGRLIRAVSTADPTLPKANLMPYSLLPLPDLDLLLVTNSSMHEVDPLGHTYQLWRLSNLELIRTEYLDTGGEQDGDVNPEEPRRGPDGSIFVQTLNCGLERITDITTDHPDAQLVHMFPGSHCGVPTIVGHFFVQSVPQINGLVVLDISKPDAPREVSRLQLDDKFVPHWTGWDAKTGRLVVTGIGEVHRLYLLTLDQRTGALALDTAFRGTDGKVGFNFDDRQWPHGWKGSANAHGVVFSR
jgi:56kDa selenium binding protein (SBP56)